MWMLPSLSPCFWVKSSAPPEEHCSQQQVHLSFFKALSHLQSISLSPKAVHKQLLHLSGTTAVFGSQWNQLLCSFSINLNPHLQAAPALGLSSIIDTGEIRSGSALAQEFRLRSWLCCREVWVNRKGRRTKHGSGSKSFTCSSVVHRNICI